MLKTIPNWTLYYTTNPIFWTNFSEDKPSREVLDAIIYTPNTGEVDPNIIFNKENFMLAEIIANIDTIQLFRINNKYWLIDEIIPRNNGTFKYKLSYDIWCNLTLPFLESQPVLHITRSNIKEFYSPILEDKIVQSIPLLYEEPINVFPHPGLGPTINTLYIDDVYTADTTDGIYNSRGINSIESPPNIYDAGIVYFVFDSNVVIEQNNNKLFTGLLTNINIGLTNFNNIINNAPFIAIPVLTESALRGGDNTYPLTGNSFEQLTKLARLGGAQFIGIFRLNAISGVLRRKFKAKNQSSDASVMYKWFYREASLGGEATLFTYLGNEDFAEYTLPDWETLDSNKYVSKYVNLYVGNSSWDDKVYAADNINYKIRISFNGAGFFGRFISTNNYLEGNIIKFGGYLTSSTDSYNNYLRQSQSQQNAGIQSAFASNMSAIASSVTTGATAAVTGNPLALAYGVSSLIGATTNSFNTRRMIFAQRADMKREQHNVIQSSDAVDNVMAIIFTDYKVNIDPKFTDYGPLWKVQLLKPRIRQLLISIFEKYGWPCIGQDTLQTLYTYVSGSDNLYIEVDNDLLWNALSKYPIPNKNQQLIMEQMNHGIRIKLKGETQNANKK